MSGTQWQFACIHIVLNTVSVSKDFKRRWRNILGSKKLLRYKLKLRVSNNFFRRLPDVNKNCVYLVILREMKCSSFFCEFLLNCRHVEFIYIRLFK